MHDFHVHSYFSNDASESMYKMADAGREAGLKGICFTDHIDLDYPGNEIEFNFSYSDYINEFSSIKSIFEGEFEVFAGVELGLQPHIMEENEALLESKSFDFVIGSVHCVNRKDMYDGSFLLGITEKEGIENYFRDMQQCIDSFMNYDVIGHIDGIRRYLTSGEKGFSYELYKELIHNVLNKLVASYKGIEINTSALRLGLSTFHPLPEILRLYRSLGGEIVTLGSDSHSTGTLGYGFKEAMKLLSDLGFKYYTIYKDRKPIFIKI